MTKRKVYTIVICAVVVCAIGYVLTIYINPGSEPIVYAEPSFVLPKTAIIVNDVAGTIKEACSESGSIEFLSWNGEWIGTDCDTDLVFHANGNVVLTEHGYSLETYNGTYSVVEATDTETAKLILDLNEYDWGWPEMAVYRDQSDLLLLPLLDSKGRVFRNRTGEYTFRHENTASFWPFRQIPNSADN